MSWTRGLAWGLVAVTYLTLGASGLQARQVTTEKEQPADLRRLVIPQGGVAAEIGSEKAVLRHLADGEEFGLSIAELLNHGQDLFKAQWTIEEGGGRPLAKGTGDGLADPTDPLDFPRNFNRLSAPDSNSCAGCHNVPRTGGGGDFVTNVFVLGHRFDFLTFDQSDPIPTKGAADETGAFPDMQDVANSRATIGMFGSGYLEMLARQITVELQSRRNNTPPGVTRSLKVFGIDYGMLYCNTDGTWDTTGVVGLPPGSTSSTGVADPPSMVVTPFHQAAAVTSLRQFTNNAMNHHHGIQSRERFGTGDPDGDGFTDEIMPADITATSVFQATLPPPGRVIQNDAEVEAAVLRGEDLFVQIGCSDCHMPKLPLARRNHNFSEPNPFNPAGNLQPGDAYESAWGTYQVNLSDPALPGPRLPTDPATRNRIIWVTAFTDFRLHDITGGPSDPNFEPLDMHATPGSPEFFAGNPAFVTKKLWGCANERPYFHHGQFTTMRQAIEAHAGEASAVKALWDALSDDDRNAVIEMLKTLQVLPEDAPALVIDENGNAKAWRDFPYVWQP